MEGAGSLEGGKAERRGESGLVGWEIADESPVSRTSFQPSSVQDPFRSYDGPDQGGMARGMARGMSRQLGLCLPKVDVRTEMNSQSSIAKEHTIRERS